MAELSDRARDYLLVARIAAEGPRHQVNFAEEDLAEEVGISSEEERIVQLSLCDAGLISLAQVSTPASSSSPWQENGTASNTAILGETRHDGQMR